jgi:membrane fusion protein, multidrug efflux system
MSDTKTKVSEEGATETVVGNGNGTASEATLPQPETTGARSGKSLIGFGLGGILGLVALVWGGITLVHALSHESTDDAFVEGHVVAISPKVSGHVVKLHIADNQVVKKGDLLLEIDPRDYEQQVKQAQAALDAAIARHKTAEHSVQLTGATGKAVIRQASSGLDASRAQADVSRVRLGQVRAQISNAEANLEQARAQVVAAEAEVARTTPDVKRYQELFEKGDVSSQRLEQATAAHQGFPQ